MSDDKITRTDSLGNRTISTIPPGCPPEIEATCRAFCKEQGGNPDEGGPSCPEWANYVQFVQTALAQRRVCQIYDKALAERESNKAKEQRSFIGMGDADGYKS